MKIITILVFFFIHLTAMENFTVECYEDISKQETINSIVTKQRTFFKPMDKRNFGTINSAIWLKISAKEGSEESIENIFSFEDNRLDRIEIYKGTLLLNVIGDLLPFSKRNIKTANAAFKILTKGENYYIRITNKGVMNIRFNIHTIDEYELQTVEEKMFYSFYFGAAILMILYNFILFLFIKERVFFEYVVYHLALVVIMFYFNGVILMNYAPNTENLNLGNVPIWLASFTVLMATQFTRSYLQTKRLLPKTDNYILLLMSFNMLSIILSVFDISYIINNVFSSLIMVVESLFLVAISLYLIIKKKSDSAKFYFIGWGVMLFSVVMIGFITLGVLPRNYITSHIFQLSSLFELLLLSMGLAFRYNQQHQLILKQKQELFTINRTLEETIFVRTEELRREVAHTKVLLKDRDILFKELYHRVKNNLQMMVSILSMQKRRIKNSDTKEILDDVTGRIKSLALIHEKLQTSNELDSINMQEYLIPLLEGIKSSYEINAIELDIKIDDVFMNIDKVTAIGLVVNELVNNSFKHAFKDVEFPLIRLSLSEKNDENQLLYSDNGVGTDKIKESKSLGSTLIKTLITSQLKGSYTIKTEPSISYTILFPL